MARAFLDDIQVVSGLVQAFTLTTIAADDLPRPSPNPAGTYHVVTVDQHGLVLNGVAGGIATLADGGTGANLSATGPGLVYQASAGAALTVVTTVAADLTFTGVLTSAGNLLTPGFADLTNATFVSLAATSLVITAGGFNFTFDATGFSAPSLHAADGVTDTFATNDGRTATVTNGIITDIS